MELQGLKASWSLRLDESQNFDKYLLQSFIGETRILIIEGEEMGEVIEF